MMQKKKDIKEKLEAWKTEYKALIEKIGEQSLYTSMNLDSKMIKDAKDLKIRINCLEWVLCEGLFSPLSSE